MPKPRVVADGPLAAEITARLSESVEILPWSVALDGSAEPVAGIYTYGHPRVDGAMLDRLTGVRIISNYGVGVDHIVLADAAARRIPVGNTPGVLDGATADMAFALLLASARRLVEGDRYARSAGFTVYDPGYMLGREVHGATIGIVGMGRIGLQIAQRARGFQMRVLYHNRRPCTDVDTGLAARYATLEELLKQSDYVVLSVPLSAQTRGLIGRAQLALMKRTATLINVARGPIVDTVALTEALTERRILAAALDVTDPEPLPRDHPLLKLDNLTIVPHLGSATVQTRQQMADISIENLLRGLRGESLLFEVRG
jgi:glyoxylate reductase